MEVTFSSAKLGKLCNSQKKLRGKCGPKMAALIQQRLVDLAAAKTLEDMRSLPGRCHELRENLDGLLAVDLVHPQRLLFEPADDPKPLKEDGGLDWNGVTKVTIVAIEDYH
jgi:plasmid maintenance system killer protein